MVQKKELESKIKRMCDYLEFYDQYGFFPFEKKRIDITLNGEIVIKLKGVENKSKLIEGLLIKSFKQWSLVKVDTPFR